MLPTLREDGDYVLVNRTSSVYKCNDVVICVCPYDAHKTICKRITAVAGEEVRVEWGNSGIYRTVEIPRGHVWLAGDNPSNSLGTHLRVWRMNVAHVCTCGD